MSVEVKGLRNRSKCRYSYMGHGPTAKTISLTIAAVFVASCGTADRTVYFEPPTDPSTTVTTAAPVAPTTTTSTTSAPQASAQASLREIDELLFMLTNAAGPLTAETYHFSAEFTMLDPQRPSPSSRNPDDYVLVLGVEGDAGADSAEFTIWNGVDVTDARIVGTTLWIHEDDQWHASEITEPAAELAALSYGDWSELTVHMIGLAALVADDTTITREPWESGELVTITAVGANADSPIVEAGMPVRTQLWLDGSGVVRKAHVEGFITLADGYFPSALTWQIDPLSQVPIIVAPIVGSELIASGS